MRLVLASKNAKKLSELRGLLAGLDLGLVAQGEFRFCWIVDYPM